MVAIVAKCDGCDEEIGGTAYCGECYAKQQKRINELNDLVKEYRTKEANESVKQLLVRSDVVELQAEKIRSLKAEIRKLKGK